MDLSNVTFEINFDHVKTKEELFNQIKKSLSLSDDFGHNLDAFYDAITDIPATNKISFSIKYLKKELLIHLIPVFCEAQSYWKEKGIVFEVSFSL